jgi:hypothetical protein
MQQIAFRQHPQLVPYLDAASKYDGDPLFRQLLAEPDHRYDPAEVRAILHALPVAPGQLRLVTNERLSGHPCSGGYDTIRIARRIVAADPEARVVMVVREQGALVESTYRQMVRMGWVGPPERLLDDLGWRTPTFHLSQFEFASIIAAYETVVPRERIKVLAYEHFRRDQPGFLHELADFLGIEPWQIEPSKRAEIVNPSRTARQIRTQRRLNRFRRSEMVPFPVAELPGRVTSAAIKAAGLLGPGRPLFSPELMAEVRARFVADNEVLRREHGIDLRP